MEQFTPEAQDIIKRIKKVVAKKPTFNLGEVIKCFEKQYELLGVPMPKVEVAKDMVLGYKIAWDMARNAAWSAAWRAAWDAAWSAAWSAAWDAAWEAAYKKIGKFMEKQYKELEEIV